MRIGSDIQLLDVYSCCEIIALHVENGNVNVQKMSLTEKDKKEMEEQIMEDESRRTVKLTVKALACKIEKVQKDRSSCVAKMKELTKEVKGLMKNDGNENDVQSAMGKLNNVYENAKGAHDSLIELIPQGEQENQNV